MKYLFWLLIGLVSATGVQAQIKNPVKWTYSAKKINATTYELHVTANIEKNWHIYTIGHKSDIGIATAVTFKNNPLVTKVGALKAVGKTVNTKDPATGEMVKVYEGKVALVQLVKLKAPVKTSVAGTVEFMSCDDKQCLPPTEQAFSISIQ